MPQHPGEVDGHAWRPHARRGIVRQVQRRFQVPARQRQLALVEERLPELDVCVESELGIAGRPGEGQQLIGDRDRTGKVGADEGDVPLATQHAFEIARPRAHEAERARPRVGRVDLVVGVALGGHQCCAERQQQIELLAWLQGGRQLGHEREPRRSAAMLSG